MAEQRYDPILQSIHWITLIVVIGAYAIGIYREELPKNDFRAFLMSLHMSIGLLVIGLTAARLSWKAYRPGPAITLPSQGARTMVKAGHAALYLMLFTIPMIGLAAAWAKGRDVTFFGLFQIPSLFPPQKAWVSPMEELHEVAANLMMALAGMHALAAIVHQYVLKDGTLSRMLPLLRRKEIASSH